MKLKNNVIRNLIIKKKANISIDIRENDDCLNYLSMDHLANLFDKNPTGEKSLSISATEYKPLRNAMAHTSLLNQDAKDKLTSVYKNIKARLEELLSDRNENEEH